MLKCTDKSQQSILQNAMAEKYGKIQRTQQNTLKQTIRITWRRQKEMHFSKRCKFQSTLIIQRRNKTYLNKISKSNQMVVELDLEPSCKRFSKSAIWENIQTKTSRTDKKKSIRTEPSTDIHQLNEGKVKCIQVLSFMSEKILAPVSRLVRIWKCSSFP